MKLSVAVAKMLFLWLSSPSLADAFFVGSQEGLLSGLLRREQARNREKSGPVRSSPSDCPDTRDDYTHHSRRTFIGETIAASTLLLATTTGSAAQAAVGNLPEYSDSNVILRGISVNVADQSQQQAMIAFLADGFDCEVLRKRIRGSVEETWLGFGPEQLSIPPDFVTPVSSFAKYGGHASIHLVYDTKATAPLYRTGDTAPGDNLAYIQMGVPAYRISQMVKNGGNILDAYGTVSVVSPAGLPIRGIVGIAPDPIMFAAINCGDVKKSKAFYEQLGFVEQEYPYCRPSKGMGQFEPPQPAKSVYMAPSQNCMGVLLLQSKSKKIASSPVVQSLDLVYTAASKSSDVDTEDSVSNMLDPSGINIQFQATDDFVKEESMTR